MKKQVGNWFPSFRAYGKITLLYMIVSFFWGKETALPTVSDHSSYPYIFQAVVTIITALIYCMTVLKARRGSIRANLIVLGFLGYFVVLAVVYFFIFTYVRGLSLELQGITGLMQILVCCLLFFYSQREIRENFQYLKQERVRKVLMSDSRGAAAVIYFFAVVLVFPISRVIAADLISSSKLLKPLVIAITSAAMYGVAPQSLQVADFACFLIISAMCISAATLLIFRRENSYIIAPILLVVLSVWVINGIKVIPFLWALLTDGLQNYEHSSMSFLEYVLAHGAQTIKINAVWFSKLIFSSVAFFVSLFYLSAIKE